MGRLDDGGRRAVALAEEEARLLGHAEIGDDHLLLGVAREDPELVGVPVASLRARVAAGRGASPGSPAELSFSSVAKAALGQVAAGRGPASAADLLAALVVADERAADVLARVGVDSLEARD